MRREEKRREEKRREEKRREEQEQEQEEEEEEGKRKHLNNTITFSRSLSSNPNKFLI
jgi:hypothetical protein